MPTAPAIHRRTIYFSGRVQGVGFRYTVRNVALNYNVHGYVRNVPDGRVELVMEGSDREMDDMLQAIKDKMEGFIRGVATDESPATGEFAHFQIRH
jgi:acylphosphatase